MSCMAIRATALCALAFVSFVVLSARLTFADTVVAGPKTYTQKGTGSPPPVKVVRTTFAAAGPGGLHILRVAAHGAASAAIAVNGQQVVGPGDFTPPAPARFNRVVTVLPGANELIVEIGGASGSGVTITIFKDTTPPTITAKATPLANANGWNKGTVTVNFKCSDSGGMATCPAPAIVSGQGANQGVFRTATDTSGNTATANVTLNIDKTAPVVTAARSPAANSYGWNNGPVEVIFSATDALSGVAPGSLSAPVMLAADGKNLSAAGHATDLAGKIGTVRSTAIKIDQTAPSIEVTLSAAPNANGWYTSPVTAHFTCSDAGSGVASCPADRVLETEGANQPISGTAVDRAGNTATASVMASLDTTAPVFNVTSPAAGAVTPAETVTITGSLTDMLSGVGGVTCAGQAITVQADGSFSHGPLPLGDGLNTFTLIATDSAGNMQQQPVSVTRQCANLLQDPGFESGVSGFVAQDASSLVTEGSDPPIEGAHSLLIAINGYGNNIWWPYAFAGGFASHFKVSARLRSDLASSSALQFCAMAYYGDGSTALSCTMVSGAAGDKGVVSAALDLDSTKALETVNIRLYQEGSEGVQFAIDTVVACLNVVTSPPPGPPPGPPGPPPGPLPPPGPNPYPGYIYQLPTVRPFISLDDYAQASPGSTAYTRFKAAADAAVGGNPPYNFSAAHSVIMYRVTGQTEYIDDAIDRVEEQVGEAEAAMAMGGVPALAGDSYLEVGWFIEQLALTYDHGYARLTEPQRLRWASYAEQAIYNVWDPGQATWGGGLHPWTGWSINDPGNNYHYSFLRATMLWALASQNITWFDFLQSQKFGPLIGYFAQLPGGGSREGTGYGTAQKNLFENYIYWRASTGEDLAGLTVHTRDTIDYWVHATVPTLDRFAPIGDQSRSSIPDLYDYHENLVHAAVVSSAGTDQARRGTWWLQQNSVNGVAHSFNLAGDLLPYPDAPAVPTALVYHAAAAGHFFARSAWDTAASWLAFVAGPYDQSHAHQDQGSFTFFKHDWLAVTSNIWSHSGINQDVDAHNVIRFVRNGSTVPQNPSTSVQSSMSYTSSGGMVNVVADLTNAYSSNPDSIGSWTRNLEFFGDVLRVHDSCTVAPDVQAIFQLHVPVLPVVQPDGSIQAGALRVVPLQPVNIGVVAMPANVDYSKGYRLELTNPAGCTFDVELQGQ
jgi:hypothetical protein